MTLPWRQLAKKIMCKYVIEQNDKNSAAAGAAGEAQIINHGGHGGIKNFEFLCVLRGNMAHQKISCQALGALLRCRR